MMADRDALTQLVESSVGRHFGKYRGIVTDNADPDGRGRVRVKVPAALGETEVWAMPCSPFAGPDVGLFALPPVGAGVWVEFEAGDLSHPIWTGCYWGAGQIPSADSKPSVRFLRTSSVSIRIDDDAGEMLLEAAGGSSIKVTGSQITIDSGEINQTCGTCKTTLNSTQFDVNSGAFTVA